MKLLKTSYFYHPTDCTPYLRDVAHHYQLAPRLKHRKPRPLHLYHHSGLTLRSYPPPALQSDIRQSRPLHHYSHQTSRLGLASDPSCGELFSLLQIVVGSLLSESTSKITCWRCIIQSDRSSNVVSSSSDSSHWLKHHSNLGESIVSK
jgi:hypothetical protein